MTNLFDLTSQFILYRFPNEECLQLEELLPGSEAGYSFHIQSFDRKKNLFFKVQNKSIVQLENLIAENFEKIFKGLKNFQTKVFTKEEYIKKCNQFINATKSKDFEKLVLSRVYKGLNNYNLIENFKKLTKKYPSALVYILKLEDEIWLGATPEILLEIKNNQLDTMALAGTRVLQGKGNKPWLMKEKHEHQVVVDYIFKALKNLNPKVKETETVTLNNLQHLMTPIHANWDEDNSLLKIIDKLHPTPAVCGIPKEKAFNYILENEGYDRSFYTGIIGWKHEDITRYFVNLRSARFSENSMDIFVGGGITEGSIAEKEYEETNLKAQALLNK